MGRCTWYVSKGPCRQNFLNFHWCCCRQNIDFVAGTWCSGRWKWPILPALANFPDKSTSLYIKKIFNSNRNFEDVYAAPDSSMCKEDPALQVSNFSSTAVTVQVGQVLGKARNPDNWLDRHSKYFEDVLWCIETHSIDQKVGSHRNS